MKYPLSLFTAGLSICIIVFSCSKKSNPYTTGPNHAMGMTNTRMWSGNSKGYVQGDTVLLPDTSHIAWPKRFSRIITDTSFAIVRINDFLVSVLGTTLNYRSTDSIGKTVVFDTVLAGSLVRTNLIYYFSKDSMVYIYYKVGDLNAATGLYYYTEDTLHTP